MSQSLNPLASNYGKSQMSADDYRRYCNKMSEIERCQERAKCCNEPPVCPEVKCADPCADPCATTSYFDFGWLGMLLLWFIIFTVLFWLIYYSLNPAFVQNEDGSINTSTVLLASIISSLILVIIIWVIFSCVKYSCE